ncbi:SAM-dependent methyltransferase [Saccharopolyspora sp. K220]|uniref:SAM-dependent methyltransferase n=1 Tax=Saccharopolyspora soli TaxID=2926618 RepID=UPI001F55C296|nr:SAM-dependent methyltransferase [Saccharopolyspora soli]MCI2415940.1 SAM-dependent methyltransferase [Saccharopolyspora soli]
MSVPSIARVYDAFVGGKDNYEVDRALYRQVLEFAPEAPAFAREHRDWLIRVVRFLAGTAGIDQFLDCGSGLPTAENTHQVAQRVNSEARVVYVDNDPVVQAHGRALLEENDRTRFVAGDLTDPAALLADPMVRGHLDFNRPLALIQCSTIHHVPDSQDPNGIMVAYIDALPSGSYVALTHWYDPADGSGVSATARRIQDLFNNGGLGSATFRSRAQIESLFTGLELLEPGLTRIADWWPSGPRLKPLADIDDIVLGGVGRKP